ncbi:MAG: hypothetical protein A2X77_03765 [Gammaproteobacteria bacterium GWE2_42_36]|nr:MAG: hypothetical protein A2X77_03765 [Gammaproteobacteria bacterium GWE2_42_36]HCU04803.1 hypothetical protein [Coxiellaceae bacterium]
MKNMTSLLQHQSGLLSDLVEKVSELQSINTILQKHLDPKMAAHCQVANYHQGKLTLVADHNTWATRIRYLAPTLLIQMRKEPIFSTILSIQCLVQMGSFQSNQPSTAISKKTDLPDETKKLIRSTAKHVRSEALKKSLLRLAD